MIISIALLGFGLSGTIISLFREYFLKHISSTVPIALVLCTISIATSVHLMNLFSFDAYFILFKPAQTWKLLGLYLILLMPFLFGSFIICLALTSKPEQVNRLYFANLIGSGIGGISALGFLAILNLKLIPGVIALISTSVLWCIDRKKVKFIPALFFSSLLITIVFGLVKPAPLKISQYKSLSKTLLLPQAKVIAERSGPLGLYTIVESPALRYAPGLSFSFSGDVQTQLGVFHDGEWVGTISEPGDTLRTEVLKKSTFALPYLFANKKSALILAAGTGQDVQLALSSGFTKVIAVEQSSELIHLLRENLAKVFLKDAFGTNLRKHNFIYNHPNVELYTEDARTFLEKEEGNFDLIVVPMLGGFVSSSAGMYALFEDYLFTIESFTKMFNNLSDDGVLCINTWMDYPPRRATKLLATIVSVLQNIGAEKPENHIAAIRSWGSVAVVIKKTELNEKDLALSKKFVEENGFDWIHYPKMTEEEANIYYKLDEPVLFQACKEFLSGNEDSFYKDYIFIASPATDNKPYFSHFLKWKALKKLKKSYDTSSIPFLEWGYVVLLSTLIQAFLISIPLVVIPLLRLKKRQREKKDLLKVFFYFGGLGMGFMFVEMLLIQKFILILGKPVFSVSVVITAILVFSGFGSLISKRLIQKSPGSIFLIFIGIAILTVLNFVNANYILPLAAGYSTFLRMLTVVIFIAPLAFLMGIPFPAGLSILSDRFSESIPFAWGVNGFASVISITLATYIAVQLGFAVVLFGSLLAYLTSGLIYLRLK